MANKLSPSLMTLPIELVYRILDSLDTVTILLSVRNVCLRLNEITDSYHPYQVNFYFILKIFNVFKSSFFSIQFSTDLNKIAFL